MCRLCSNDPEDVKAGRADLARLATILEELARDHRSMACGVLKPHSHEMHRVSELAKSMIRRLAEEYL
jgi:hypothetical protein